MYGGLKSYLFLSFQEPIQSNQSPAEYHVSYLLEDLPSENRKRLNRLSTKLSPSSDYRQGIILFP